ncbi:MAG: type II secretion system ATPase GspE [Planctomycetes bacterium]|nr:type II secretion system ATPase GspE [Planctomycetota bacterium]
MTTTLSRESISDFLQRELSLPREKVQHALTLPYTTGEPLDRALVAGGVMTERGMLEAFAKYLGYPYIEKLGDFTVPPVFMERVPIQFARNHNLMAIREEHGAVYVATCSPLDVHPMDDLATMLQREVLPVLSTRSEIANAINRAFQQKVNVVDEMLEDLNTADLEGISKEIEGTQDLLDLANKAPIIKLVNMILFQALKMRASDVHLQPFEEKMQVRYRIDGILYDMMTPPKKIQEAIISRVKVMGKMDIAERRLPQDGRTSLRIGDNEIDVRISSVPTSNGERIVMRLLDKSARLYELEELGMDEDYLKLFQQLIGCEHGIVFLTGPTGSGKTTTLYSALKRINTAKENIITIEDPIEYHLPGISQIEVSNKKGLTFASGLRSIVRQDPDIIMIGEVRDRETAEIAIQSALTGHLVFSTLHTNDAAGAVTRLLDLGVEPYLVASSLIGAGAQRLVRIICKDCREPYTPTDEELRDIGLERSGLKNGVIWRGKGCSKCFGTGYLDRTCILEMIMVNDHIRQQVMDRVGSNRIKQDAVASGMRTLRMDGARKVQRGITTVEEVLRVTQMDTI